MSSFRQKLYLLGGIALAVIAALALSIAAANKGVVSAISDHEQLRSERDATDLLIRKIKDMALLTMEILADRRLGPVSAERRTAIAALNADVEAGLALVREGARDDAERQAWTEAHQAAGRFLPVFRTELVRVVESDADEAALEALDQTIDLPADRAVAALESLRQSKGRQLEASRQDMEARLALSNRAILLGAPLSALALALGLLLIGRSILRPLDGITEAMGRLAAGDKQTAIPGLDRNDEVGRIAAAVRVFRECMLKAERLDLARAAEGERQQHRTERMAEAVQAFDSEIGQTLSAFNSVVHLVQEASEGLNNTADETSGLSTTMAGAAEEAAGSLHGVTSAAHQLDASVHEISRRIESSSGIMRTAVHSVQGTAGTMRQLAEAAEKIGDIVRIIDDIAHQTNMLALNATIEAARAGEAGRGFGVVASEVKLLATQTGHATEQITHQIRGIQATSGQAVTAIQGIGDTIAQVSEAVTAIAGAVEQQNAATRAIASNVQQAAGDTTAISNSVMGIFAAVTRTGAMAGDMVAIASSLTDEAGTLRSRVESFLGRIREL
jgi:methyl-accepting chemotaxis protein